MQTLQTASDCEKLRFLRVTDETCGNTYTGQVRYFRDIPTFTFGYVNRKKLIGYGKLVLAIKKAYEEQQPSFEREILNELLHQLFAYRYSNKKYAFLFEKSPLPDTYAEILQNHDISRKEWQETVQRNRAIDFIRNCVFDNYNLENYLKNQGWRYRFYTINNLSWTLPVFSEAITLKGRYLDPDSSLFKNLSDKYPDMFEGNCVKFLNNPYNPKFVLINYKRSLTQNNHHLSETIKFRIINQDEKTMTNMYEKTLIIDQNLLAETNYYSRKLLDIADKLVS